jgi:murein DD-endopeptidase MepM/ murein hydrolase activator NlpD
MLRMRHLSVRSRARFAERDGGGGLLRRARASLCFPLWVLLCLTPFLLGATTTAGLERIPSSQPVRPSVPSLLDKLLELRRSLTQGSQPVFPAPPGYRLPWAAGISHAVTQGPGGKPTHQSLYAWDFDLRYELVLAARGGRVSMVRDSERIGGCDSALGGRSNYILIDHGDGTSALYLHIDYQGALVQEGALVAQGDAIAYSGSSGLSCGGGGWAGPHLHFQVERTVPGNFWTATIPVTFDDLKGDTPVVGMSYVSANLPRGLLARALMRRFPDRAARGQEIYVPPSRSLLAERARLPAATPIATRTRTPLPTPTATPTPMPSWWIYPSDRSSEIPVPKSPPPPPLPEIPVPRNPAPPPAAPTATPTPTG